MWHHSCEGHNAFLQTKQMSIMVIEPTNAYKHLRVSYMHSCLHVSATLVAILRGAHYTDYITKTFKPMHKRKILSIKKYDLKYILK
jgi:hypothetical protein